MNEYCSARTLYLGVNIMNHDSAVAAFYRGKMFALAEERVTRFKHDSLWPFGALSRAGSALCSGSPPPLEVRVGVPLLCLERMEVPDLYSMELQRRRKIGGRFQAEYDHNSQRVTDAGRLALEQEVWQGQMSKPLRAQLENYVQQQFPLSSVKVQFFDHHSSHAAIAGAASGFNRAVVITMDGWGDNSFTKVFVMETYTLKLIADSPSFSVSADRVPPGIPQRVTESGIFQELSPGHLYSIITHLAGFRPVCDEGKLEALAAYGHADRTLLSQFHDWFYCEGLSIRTRPEPCLASLYDEKFLRELRAMPREALAATAQSFLEELYLQLIGNACRELGCCNVVLSGGVAANIILNMKVFEKLGKNVFVYPAMADDGAAVGALWTLMDENNDQFAMQKLANEQMPYWGTEYSAEETLHAIKARECLRSGFKFVGMEGIVLCADLIAQGQIGAIFQGRAEFGPRALGNRSIVADIRRIGNVDKLNLQVKKRPGFQPFCPSFIVEEMDRLFISAYNNKHMTCGFHLKPQFVQELPCAVHVDGTARAQFVSRNDNPHFYALLSELKQITGFGAVINTSFNMHGRTICETPEDALDDFLDGGLEFLFINGYLIERKVCAIT